jgi:DegV family protein with EDD domain
MMKRQVRIVTDSTSDLPPELCQRLGIEVVPLNVHFGEVAYRDQIDLDADQFFRLLAQSTELPKTSQPAVGLFEEAYARLSADGSAIVSIHLSSKLSGTIHSAELARDTQRARCLVEVIDSDSASLGLGLIVMAAAELANQGADQRQVVSLVRRLAANVHILFVVETLEYLQRGGRIGRASGLLGTLLNIRPVLKLEEGEVRPVEKVRTRSKALDRLVEFVELFPDIEQLAIVHNAAPPDVETLLRRLELFYPRERILVGRYGPVIGTHAGPGGIGVVVSQGVTG